MSLVSTLLSAFYHYYDAKYSPRLTPSPHEYLMTRAPYGTPALRRNIAHAVHRAAFDSDTFLKSPELRNYVPR
jgi:hypothetical protein